MDINHTTGFIVNADKTFIFFYLRNLFTELDFYTVHTLIETSLIFILRVHRLFFIGLVPDLNQ